MVLWGIKMNKKENEFVVWAFIKYDIYPYLTWHRSSKINDRSKVFLPTYGSFVTPLFTLSIEEGDKLIAEITKLKYNKRKDSIELDKKYQDKLDSLLKLFN